MVKSYLVVDGSPWDYCDSLSPKNWIWDFRLRLWTQALRTLGFGLGTQACQFRRACSQALANPLENETPWCLVLTHKHRDRCITVSCYQLHVNLVVGTFRNGLSSIFCFNPWRVRGTLSWFSGHLWTPRASNSSQSCCLSSGPLALPAHSEIIFTYDDVSRA